MQAKRSKDRSARNRLTFPKGVRLRTRAEFDRVLKQGRRVGDARITLWVIASDLPQARLGIVIGRRHGNSPQRNRLKRLIREAFRVHRPEMPPGIDIAVSVRPGVKITLRDLEASLLALVALAMRRMSHS